MIIHGKRVTWLWISRIYINIFNLVAHGLNYKCSLNIRLVSTVVSIYHVYFLASKFIKFEKKTLILFPKQPLLYLWPHKYESVIIYSIAILNDMQIRYESSFQQFTTSAHLEVLFRERCFLNLNCCFNLDTHEC